MALPIFVIEKFNLENRMEQLEEAITIYGMAQQWNSIRTALAQQWYKYVDTGRLCMRERSECVYFDKKKATKSEHKKKGVMLAYV